MAGGAGAARIHVARSPYRPLLRQPRGQMLPAPQRANRAISRSRHLPQPLAVKPLKLERNTQAARGSGREIRSRSPRTTQGRLLRAGWHSGRMNDPQDCFARYDRVDISAAGTSVTDRAVIAAGGAPMQFAVARIEGLAHRAPRKTRGCGRPATGERCAGPKIKTRFGRADLHCEPPLRSSDANLPPQGPPNV